MLGLLGVGMVVAGSGAQIGLTGWGDAVVFVAVLVFVFGGLVIQRMRADAGGACGDDAGVVSDRHLADDVVAVAGADVFCGGGIRRQQHHLECRHRAPGHQPRRAVRELAADIRAAVRLAVPGRTRPPDARRGTGLRAGRNVAGIAPRGACRAAQRAGIRQGA
ncbi:hypothetical protein G6F22_018039 [Rhizopus arrhizus]|nr:hypothetical protein G6F22_018039 [Rhizopus arrhizus]